MEQIPDGFYKDKNGNISQRTCTCGKTNDLVESCDCQQPKKEFNGLPGWICPVCGRGNAPYTSTCPCVPLPPFSITCNTITPNQ